MLSGTNTHPQPTIASHSHLRKNAQAVAARASVPLGNNADLASRTKKLQSQRARYQLQKTARDILPQNHRIQSCHRTTAYGTTYATIETNGERSRLSGVHTCDCGYACPVCAPKIAMKHANELAAATTAAYARGWRVLHVIYTLSHHKGVSLHDVLSSITDARRKYFLAGRGYQKIKSDAGIEGTARALETTYGENGWHPHFHELLFVRMELPSDFEETLKNRWIDAVAKVGGYADHEHGLRIEEGHAQISEYLNKFGRLPESGGHAVEMELSHGYAKNARKNGKTPFALLHAASQGDTQSARLFCEYSTCMAGRALIRWSKGLREALGLSGVESESADISEPIFAELAGFSWHALKLISDECILPAVLLAATAGYEALRELLDLYDLIPDVDIPRLFVPRDYKQVGRNRNS